MMEWKIFVEGPCDKKFLSSLLYHLNLSEVEIVPLGGGVSSLKRVAPLMREIRASGQLISVVLDADTDFGVRRAEYEDVRVRCDLPVDRLFLLPNHQDAGCLETLLEQISVSEHRVVYDCFRQYEDCLRRRSSSYVLPNQKARIYAYCEALDIETNASRRDHGDSSHWNLDAGALRPLKKFLRDLCAGGLKAGC